MLTTLRVSNNVLTVKWTGKGTISSRQAQRRRRRPHVRLVAAPHASAESERLLLHRLAAKGWEAPDPAFNPLVAEAWSAANAIYSQVLETPLQLAPWLAERAPGGCCVHLKLETRQVTGSFKARGAAHKLLSALPAALARGVHAASAGSHALAVLHAAAAAARRGTSSGIDSVRVTIHLPAGSHPAAADRLRALGARVVLSAAASAEGAEAEARAAAAEQGGVFVSAFDDVAVAGAQGTVALELLMQAERGHLDAVFVPVGGGGLAAGMAAVLKAAAPHVHVVACQPEGGDAMARSVAAGRAVHLPQGSAGGLAEGREGSGGIQEGSVTLEPCMRFVDEWVTVPQADVARAMVEVGTHTGIVAEAGSAAAVAAFERAAPAMQHRHVVIIIGGGLSQEQLERAYAVATAQRG